MESFTPTISLPKHLPLLRCALSKLHKNSIKVQWLEPSQGKKKEKGKAKERPKDV
jgi:hypothetical protein